MGGPPQASLMNSVPNVFSNYFFKKLIKVAYFLHLFMFNYF